MDWDARPTRSFISADSEEEEVETAAKTARQASTTLNFKFNLGVCATCMETTAGLRAVGASTAFTLANIED